MSNTNQSRFQQQPSYSTGNPGNAPSGFKLNQTGFASNMPGHPSANTRQHDQMITRQAPRTVKEEGAGIGLPVEIRHEMAAQLDTHQCALTVTLHMFQKHHVLTEGAESFLSLHELYAEQRDLTVDHIDKVMERVARLGGVPTAHLEAQHQLSYIKHEAEGRYTMRDFVRNDLEHELKIQEQMRKTIGRAKELNDFGTVEILEQVLIDREDFGYHLYSLLEDDSLVRGMGHLFDGNDIESHRKPVSYQTPQ